jgi:hypothetical protein
MKDIVEGVRAGAGSLIAEENIKFGAYVVPAIPARVLKIYLVSRRDFVLASK